jgi:hypothetical protein
MEVQDGFIVGIFNYCDRWCEACAFTSRCRVFAGSAVHAATTDAPLQATLTGQPLKRLNGDDSEAPGWWQRVVEQINQAVASAMADHAVEGPVAAEHLVIEERTHEYSLAVHRWLRVQRVSGDVRFPEHPVGVIAWNAHLIASQTYRATRALASERDGEAAAYSDGSAKAALVAIERSRGAWLELVRRGVVSPAQAEPFIGDLAWASAELERVFPRARAFIRPGLDEVKIIG